MFLNPSASNFAPNSPGDAIDALSKQVATIKYETELKRLELVKIQSMNRATEARLKQENERLFQLSKEEVHESAAHDALEIRRQSFHQCKEMMSTVLVEIELSDKVQDMSLELQKKDLMQKLDSYQQKEDDMLLRVARFLYPAIGLPNWPELEAELLQQVGGPTEAVAESDEASHKQPKANHPAITSKASAHAHGVSANTDGQSDHVARRGELTQMLELLDSVEAYLKDHEDHYDQDRLESFYMRLAEARATLQPFL